jgi:tyrosinase
VAKGVTRVIDATKSARALGLQPTSPVSVGLAVTDVATKRILSPEEIAKLPGFIAKAVWSGAPATPTVEETAPTGAGHSCCH